MMEIKTKEITWTDGQYSTSGKVDDIKLFSYEWNMTSSSDGKNYVLHNSIPGYKTRMLCADIEECKNKADMILRLFVNRMIDNDEYEEDDSSVPCGDTHIPSCYDCDDLSCDHNKNE